jgi:hypothetical protein
MAWGCSEDSVCLPETGALKWQHAGMNKSYGVRSGDGREGVPWASSGRPRRKWGCAFMALCLLAGIGGAILVCLGIAVSWSGCHDELEGGGNFAISFLCIAALLVFPSVAGVSGAVASATHALLRRITRLEQRADIAATLITAVGAIALVVLMALWMKWGNPPDGYCDGPAA